MTSSSRDIYFHTPSLNQRKLLPVEKYWLESFIINSLSSLLLITYHFKSEVEINDTWGARKCFSF